MKCIKKEINKIPVFFYQSSKYKTINIRMVFLNHFTKENATNYSLLTSILSNTSKKYNTKKKVSNVLMDLYGANIYMSSYSIHKTRITSFTLTMINEKFLDEKILNKGIKLLEEFILNPNVVINENNQKVFDEKVFNEEKSILKDEINKDFNNKNRYALHQMVKNMCKDEIVSVSNMGNLDDLEKLTAKDIYDTYIDLLTNSIKSIYLIGEFNDDFINETGKKIPFLNKLNQSSMNLETILQDNIEVKEVKEIKEKANVNQANLIIGFRTSINNVSPDFEALQLFITMFGGLYTSNLFQVVREQNSLAYSINASLIGDAKLMICNAGIDSDNYEKTIDLIKQELLKYQNNEIDEELLTMAKADIIEEIEETEDKPGHFLSTVIENNLLNIPNDFNLAKEKIIKVTKDDIVRVSKTIVLDTIYMLSK